MNYLQLQNLCCWSLLVQWLRTFWLLQRLPIKPSGPHLLKSSLSQTDQSSQRHLWARRRQRTIYRELDVIVVVVIVFCLFVFVCFLFVCLLLLLSCCFLFLVVCFLENVLELAHTAAHGISYLEALWMSGDDLSKNEYINGVYRELCRNISTGHI